MLPLFLCLPARLDGVKTYMALRRVPLKLQDRVIKWFDYLWMCNKSADEEKSLGLLPDKLKVDQALSRFRTSFCDWLWKYPVVKLNIYENL